MARGTSAELTTAGDAAGLRRLFDFAEPTHSDVCLDVTLGGGPVAAVMRRRVHRVVTVDAGPAAASLPDSMPPAPVGNGSSAAHAERAGESADLVPVRVAATALPYRTSTFTLVTVRCLLHRLADPVAAVREMLRVSRPDGRLIVANLVRRNSAASERDRLERLRDPAHADTPSVARLTGLLTDAGADVRRLDLFTVERPVEPWLAGACDDTSATKIRAALIAEVDGGPCTGAKPRMIGGELWFTQSWAHLAATQA